jgi:hypothetical protein
MADQPAASTETTETTASAAISAGDFGAAFKGFLERTVAAAPEEEPVFAARLRAHFATDAALLPIVAEHLEPSEHPTSRPRWTHGSSGLGARRRPWA